MDEFSSRRTTITRKGPGLVLRDSSENPKDRNIQVCSRAGCSSKLNPTKPSRIDSPSSSKAKSFKIPFRPPGPGKEIIGSSSKITSTSRKPIEKSIKLRSRDSLTNSLREKSAQPESSTNPRRFRLVSQNNEGTSKPSLRSIRCNSFSDVVSSSSTESPVGKRRDIGRKTVREPEIRRTVTRDRNETTSVKNRGSISRTRIGNQENGRRLPTLESPVQTPSPPPQSETSVDSETRFSAQSPSRSSFSGSSYANRGGGLRQYNLDGIAEMLLALERIEQEEDPSSYEQLLVLETNLFLGGVGFHDQHREMRLDIDSMSYEELLALEERIGTVSTGVSEEDVGLCLKRFIFKGINKSSSSSSSRENEKCSICQEEYGKGEEVGRLNKCEHSYHVECISNWFRIKNWCPICKADVLPSSSS